MSNDNNSNKDNKDSSAKPTQPTNVLARFWAWLTGAQPVRDYNTTVEALLQAQPVPPPELVPEIDNAVAESVEPDYTAARSRAAVAALKKAKSWIGKKTKYKLGDSTPGRSCDCSGLTAAAFGYKRDDGSVLGPDDGIYHFTNSIAADANDNQDFYVKLDAPQVGCMIVYPGITLRGKRVRIGHIGLVSFIPPNWDGDVAKLKVVHCSSGNYKKTGDAIQETAATAWKNKGTYNGVTKKAYATIFVMPKVEKLKQPG